MWNYIVEKLFLALSYFCISLSPYLLFLLSLSLSLWCVRMLSLRGHDLLIYFVQVPSIHLVTTDTANLDRAIGLQDPHPHW